MSEIQTSSGRSDRVGIRSKKLSTRVDLTPMVDLGFLLITFFIFTTTMQQPMVMKLLMPDDSNVDNPSKAPATRTISFILGGDNTVYYYYGLHKETMLTTDYSAAGLRAVIQEKIRILSARPDNKGGLIVLIKPTNGASYQNIIDMLDEMSINDVKTYMLVEPDKDETKGLNI